MEEEHLDFFGDYPKSNKKKEEPPPKPQSEVELAQERFKQLVVTMEGILLARFRGGEEQLKGLTKGDLESFLVQAERRDTNLGNALARVYPGEKSKALQQARDNLIKRTKK